MTQSLLSPQRLLAILAFAGFFAASSSHATLLDEKKTLEHYDDGYRMFLKKKIAKRFVLKEVLTDDSVTKEAIYFLNAIQAARLSNYLHLVEAIREHESLIRARYPVYIQGAFLMACADVLEKFPLSQEQNLITFEESKENLALKEDFVEIAKILVDEAEKEMPTFEMDPIEQYQSVLEHLDRPASIHVVGPDNTKTKDQFVSTTTEHAQHNFAYYSVKTIASEEVFLSITKAILQKQEKDRLNIVFFLPLDHKTAPFHIQRSLLMLNHHDFGVVFRNIDTIRKVEDRLAKRQQILEEQKPPAPPKDAKASQNAQQKLASQVKGKRQLKGITDRHGRKINSWVQAAAITGIVPPSPVQAPTQAVPHAQPQVSGAKAQSKSQKGAATKSLLSAASGSSQSVMPQAAAPQSTTPQGISKAQPALPAIQLPSVAKPATAPTAPPQPAHQVVQIQVNPAPAPTPEQAPAPTPTTVQVVPAPAAPTQTPAPVASTQEAHKPAQKPQTKPKPQPDSIKVYTPKWPPMPPQEAKPELPPGPPIKYRTAPNTQGRVQDQVTDLVTEAPEEHTTLTPSGSEHKS